MEAIQAQLDHILFIVRCSLGVTGLFSFIAIGHVLMMRGEMKASNRMQETNNNIGAETVGLLREIDNKLGVQILQ